MIRLYFFKEIQFNPIKELYLTRNPISIRGRRCDHYKYKVITLVLKRTILFSVLEHKAFIIKILFNPYLLSHRSYPPAFIIFACDFVSVQD